MLLNRRAEETNQCKAGSLKDATTVHSSGRSHDHHNQTRQADTTYSEKSGKFKATSSGDTVRNCVCSTMRIQQISVQAADVANQECRG